MSNINIKSMFSIAKSEYIRWITNPRIIIVGVLLIFMRSLAIEPLLERAEKFGGKLNVLEPFAAIGNSKMLILLMPCVFLILISDYPIISGNTLFFIQRTGKLNWFLGQVFFIFSAIISYLFFILFVSVIWMHYEEILSKPIFPVWFSFLYFFIAVIVLLICNLIAIKRLQFINIEQL